MHSSCHNEEASGKRMLSVSIARTAALQVEMSTTTRTSTSDPAHSNLICSTKAGWLKLDQFLSRRRETTQVVKVVTKCLCLRTKSLSCLSLRDCTIAANSEEMHQTTVQKIRPGNARRSDALFPPGPETQRIKPILSSELNDLITLFQRLKLPIVSPNLDIHDIVLSRPRIHRLLLRRQMLSHRRTVHLLPLRIAHLHRSARHFRYPTSVRRRRSLLLRRLVLRLSHMWRRRLGVHRRRLDGVLGVLRLIVNGVEVRVFGGMVAGG